MVEHQPPHEAYEPNEPRASARADAHAPRSATASGNSGSETSVPDIERFFCIYCGYDLTGHSGDERRCPECGKTTTLEELRATLAMKKGISAWEAPVLPCLLFLPAVFFGPPGLLTEGFDWFRSTFLILFAISAAAWFWSLSMYFRRYGHHYDRLLFLGESHLLAIQIGFGGAFFAGSLVVLILSRFDSDVILAASGSAMFVAPSVWIYRDMKRRLRAYKLPKPSETNANE